MCVFVCSTNSRLDEAEVSAATKLLHAVAPGTQRRAQLMSAALNNVAAKKDDDEDDDRWDDP